MFSAAYKTRLATAMAGAALASALVVSGASADQHAIDAAARDAAGLASAPDDRQVTYDDLRSPDARDAARQAAGQGLPRQDLRSPDARDAADGYRPTLEPQPAADQPSSPSGFDWASAAIGAAAGTGLLLILLAAIAGSGRLRHPRPVNVGSQGTVGS
jgi:hypothetical protein